MTTPGSQKCATCGGLIGHGSRFCPRCGAPTPDDVVAEEILLPGSRRVRVSADSLSLRELLAIVESGVFYWRQRLAESEGVARTEAAAALQDLSRILDSLAQQLVAGRETVRITSRLPSMRNAQRACAICGRGNRSNAKFCIACGAALRPGNRATPPPPPEIRVTVAARSDVGMVRKINEDTYYSGEFTTVDGSIGTLLLVADGMGGHQSGEVASQLAAETVKMVLGQGLSQEVPSDDAGWHALLRHAVLTANERIYQQSRSQAGRSMGTTLTIALITERRAHIAHVGDSRAYLINAAGVGEEHGTWVQLTSDHSLVARLVDIGQLTPEQARIHPQRNMIYRSLGTDPNLEVDLFSQALALGDTLLLCSDGLDTHVEDAEIAQIVLEEVSEIRACEDLIALANQRGGKDNISVVIARIRA
ncbi:Stp1/IreP family PP2C-type Ser/Thr phosphatase [Candidatus Oscillochloris fontis]|uniref:Stp1/IreP family PP2C-type Ser/Thr phosphatase n=1 Tax=Candidatus Oscillochloris fontis TaxID=2496868 RepID=UPI001EE8D2E3|nr:Stp1/IreP family PP2C-type Ser/Thr phosphatase [Candidatus Oscillochloris fontis]